MPRIAKQLSALAVKRIIEPGMHAVGVVPGLHLQVTTAEARSWVLRVTVGISKDGRQRRREIGLGGYPAVTLQQARDKARQVRGQLAQGIDPVAVRQSTRVALAASHAAELTFAEAAGRYIEAKAAQWGPKSFQQWTNTLRTFAFPVVGELQVRNIDMPHILRVLEPIWVTKTETAKRLRGRIEAVLDWATVRKYRAGPNPARWRGNLDTMLPEPAKVAVRTHQPALDYSEAAVFMRHLRRMEGVGAQSLEFAILTAARSGEVRGATWDEVRLDKRQWVVPAKRMKAGREHVVPLSDGAVRLLKSVPRCEGSPLVFVAPRGGQLSDATLGKVIKRMHLAAIEGDRQGYVDRNEVGVDGRPRIVTLHGFRSTFRDWAAEQTGHPHDVVEMALAHAIGNRVEAAYRRGDLFEKRRALMEDWYGYCYPEKEG